MTILHRAKWAVIGAAKRMDAEPGLSRDAVRSALGVVATTGLTARNRRVTTLRWSRRDQQWRHHWPEGRVEDNRWWRTPIMWSTHGGGYDLEDLLWRHYRPGPGDVVVDVGAGNGGETFWLTGMVGASGRVVAIEAEPATYARLTRLVGLNGWSNVEAVHTALASTNGTVRMSDSDDWVAGNMFEGGGAEVSATTLDDLCAERGIERVDWLKMNIEGAEKDALLGMERMAPHIRNLTISCHDFLDTDWGRSKADVLAWLGAHGYVVAEHGPGNPAEQDYVYAWREQPAP